MKRVIKIGGRAQSAPDLPGRIASAWNAAPGSFCVVHGGGDDISAVQRLMGSEPRFVNGRRFTTPEDIDIIRMVLSGLVNKKLVSSLVALGVPAAGISGEDAGTITATPLDPDSLGHAGKPVAVNLNLIRTLLDAGYLPVISPLATDDSETTGEALNVNGDDAAAAIAIALGAGELLLIADVAGVSGESGELIGSLDQAECFELTQAGVISQGMLAKLEAGFVALAGGVARTRISSVDGLSDSAIGTVLTLARSLTT